MDAAVKTVVISGYYGFGNSGDEGVLQSILLALKEQGALCGLSLEPVVLSVRPEWTKSMYGVKAVHRMKPMEVFRTIRQSDALISGGGSLLQDVTGWGSIPYYLGIVRMAQLLGKPTFIYSQGIGPVRRRVFPPLIRSVFKRAQYISVRDAESARMLERFGILPERIDIVPDPVMGLSLSDSAEKNTARPLIGVSVRFWNSDRSDLQGLAESLRIILRERQVRLRFLPFHLPSDEEASLYVLRSLGLSPEEAEIVRDAGHPLEMMEKVAECDLLIGMRLHSLIYAASRYVPMVGVSYDPKIDRFLEQLGMKPAGYVRNLSPQAVADEAIRLLDSRKEWVEETKSAIERLKRQAQKPAQQISTFLRLKG